jgi:hypothetical protein
MSKINKHIINNKHAYVVLQIDKSEYISASLVLANSLRKTCITNDLVIMINSKISEECKNLLLSEYDKVVIVSKISKKMSVNKLLGMELTEYEKIIIIDIDSIIFKNIDFLFKSNTPSIIKDNNDLKGNTGIIIIKPNKKKFRKIKEKIKKNEDITVEDILENEYKKIHKLDRNILSSNKYDKKSYGIQYNKYKPFLLKSDISLEKRIKWNYFNLWHYYFRNVINKGDDISKYECIKNVIELSRNYLPNMIKFMLNNEEILSNRNKNIIKKIYNLKKGTEINNYHTNISLEYNNKEMIYNTNDYVMKDIIKYYNTTRQKNIKIYENINILLKNIKKKEVENFLNMYIRIKSNVFIIIDINEANINEANIKDERIGNSIIYVKEIEGNGLVIKNIIFDIDERFTYKIRNNKYNNLKKSKKYKLRLIIYENKVNNNYIYNEYKNLTIMLNDMQSKIRVSSILLNNETLKKYIKNEIGMIKNDDIINTNKLLERMREQTIKKWIYNNYSANDIEKLLVKIKNKKIIVYECFEENKINKSNNIEIIEIKKDKKKENLIKIINNKYYEKDGIKYMI